MEESPTEADEDDSGDESEENEEDSRAAFWKQYDRAEEARESEQQLRDDYAGIAKQAKDTAKRVNVCKEQIRDVSHQSSHESSH